MPTGPIRAAYCYHYMDTPGIAFTGAPNTNHLDDLASVGINTVMVKMLIDTATPLLVKQWKAFAAKAAEKNLTLWPVFNYQNDCYRDLYSTPDRRYQVTSGPLSINRSIACPNDPRYMRAMLTNAFQILPDTTRIIMDPEFPGGPGGFHSYTNPCFCGPCRVEYYRSVNCVGQNCFIDPADVVLPTNAVLLAFQQTLHQSRITLYAKQAGYREVGILHNDSGDSFITYTTAGFRAADHTTTVFSELSYPSTSYGVDGTLGANLPAAGAVGGVWLEKWTPANLTTRIKDGNLPDGYWLFTTYSFWRGQTSIDTTATPYGLKISPAVSVGSCTISGTAVTTTGNFNTAGVRAPAFVQGIGITPGTKVSSVGGPTALTLTQAGTAGTVTLLFSITVASCVMDGSINVTSANNFITAGVAVGAYVYGTGVQAVTTVVTVAAGAITLNKTASPGTFALTFTSSVGDYYTAIAAANA